MFLRMVGRKAGFKHSKEAKEKMSIAKNGKKLTDEHKNNIGKSMKGRDVSGWIWKTGKKIKEGVKNGTIVYETGEKARNWRNAKSKDIQAIRGSKEYAIWRMSVFERDDFTCQCCDHRGGKLNAHHIKSFKNYPELRLDVNNGATLCIPCHNLTKGGNFKTNNMEKEVK